MFVRKILTLSSNAGLEIQEMEHGQNGLHGLSRKDILSKRFLLCKPLFRFSLTPRFIEGVKPKKPPPLHENRFNGFSSD